MPNALLRSFGAVNVVVSSDSAAGTSSAANAPWQARAVISMAKLTDAPPMADTPANPARPVRPRMSQRRSLALSPEMASGITFTTPFSVFTEFRAEASCCRPLASRRALRGGVAGRPAHRGQRRGLVADEQERCVLRG